MTHYWAAWYYVKLRGGGRRRKFVGRGEGRTEALARADMNRFVERRYDREIAERGDYTVLDCKVSTRRV